MGVRNKRPDLNGVLVIDKPYGWTSAKAVAFARRATGGAKVGHAGTLDPLATGVLVLCIGRATRLVESFMNSPKAYRATIDLSRTSESHDLERDTSVVPVACPPNRVEVEAALTKFVGSILQMPPAHSAVKLGGKRAYDLARRGRLSDTGGGDDAGSGMDGHAPAEAALKLEPKRVRIDALSILSYEWPLLAVAIDCGRGTYIRSLARDLGAALGTGGVLTGLVRTRSGSFSIEDAKPVTVFDQPIGAAQIIPITPEKPAANQN